MAGTANTQVHNSGREWPELCLPWPELGHGGRNMVLLGAFEYNANKPLIH